MVRMKIIGVASIDDALDNALTLLFQSKYQIIDVNFQENYVNEFHLKPIDLLIIDVKAIDENVLKKILMLKRMRTNLPIIMLYDLKVPEYVKSDLFPLADVMFRKPFSNQQLLSAVDDFLQKQANFN